MQGIPVSEVLLRDALAGSTAMIAFTLVLMTNALLKKSHGPFSATSGLAVYFSTFLVYTIATDVTLLYRDTLEDIFLNASLPEILGGGIWVLGINVFIYTVERNMMSEGRKQKRVTLLTVAYTICFGFVIPLGVVPYLIFIGLAFALVYVSWKYLKALLQLEVARRRFPQFWFALSFNLSGFANFFILADYSYSGFLAKNLMILAGTLILLRVWNDLPSAHDLNWLLTLDRLIVVDPESSVPLIDFRFRAARPEAETSTEPAQDNGALVAGAVGGIDRLMDEILEDTDGLGEIVHGKKTILFLRRERFTCMLVTDRSMDETRYRLETFALSFEREYRDELSLFSGDVRKFSKADDLVREAFL